MENTMKYENLEMLTEFFRLMGDPTRVRILLLLSSHEFCVRDIAQKLNTTGSVISHQLSTLKAHKLVRQRREGNLIYYSLSNKNICDLIKNGYEYI